MVLEYKDFAGKTISAPCFIVYAAQSGHSAILKFGFVTKLSARKDPIGNELVPTLKIIAVHRLANGWEIQAEGREVVITWLDKVMVIEEKYVPEKARDILKKHDAIMNIRMKQLAKNDATQ